MVGKKYLLRSACWEICGLLTVRNFSVQPLECFERWDVLNAGVRQLPCHLIGLLERVRQVIGVRSLAGIRITGDVRVQRKIVFVVAVQR